MIGPRLIVKQIRTPLKLPMSLVNKKLRHRMKRNRTQIFKQLRACFILGTFLFAMVPSTCIGQEKEALECMSITRRRHSSAFPDPTYDELRARALAAAGHIPESIPWFIKALSRACTYSRPFLERECGEAFEKLGKSGEALDHYRKGGLYYSGQAEAALLIKLRRFDEAKRVCNRGVAQERSFSHQYLSYDGDLCNWLRLRAEAEIELQDKKSAVSDLREAAACYAQNNTKLLEQCTASIQKLTSEHSDGSIKPSDLPAQDKATVLKILKELTTLSADLDVNHVNRLTGASLKLPGAFVNSDQQDKVTPSLYQIDYRTNEKFDPKTAFLRITLWTHNCAIPKEQILAALPPPSPRVPITEWFGDSPIPNAATWNRPEGTLIISFEDSGFMVANYIEWRAAKLAPCRENNARSEYTSALRDEEHNDLRSATMHASKAADLVLSERDPVNLKGSILEERAKLYAKQNMMNKALSDSAEAVCAGGYQFLQTRIDLLVNCGQTTAALDELSMAISRSEYERERSLFRLLAAKLYLQEGRYVHAIESADECIVSEDKPDYADAGKMPRYMGPYFSEVERMSAPALVIKARAESKLARTDDAIRDADLAASRYFDIAQIECRDKVRDWAKRLTSSQH